MNVNEEVSGKEYRAHKKQLKKRRKQLVRSEGAATAPAITKKGKEKRLKRRKDFYNDLVNTESEMSEIRSKYDITNRKDRRKLKKLHKITYGNKNKNQYDFKHRIDAGIGSAYWTNSYRAPIKEDLDLNEKAKILKRKK